MICLHYKGKEYFQDHKLIENEHKIKVNLEKKESFKRANDATEYFKYIRHSKLQNKFFDDKIHNEGKNELENIWNIIGKIPSLQTKNISLVYVNGKLMDYIFISAPVTLDEVVLVEEVSHEKFSILKKYMLIDIDSVGASFQHVLNPNQMGYLKFLIDNHKDYFQPFEHEVFEKRNSDTNGRKNFNGNFGHAEQAILGFIYSNNLDKEPIKIDIISMYDPCPICLRTLFLLSSKDFLINMSSLKEHLPSKSRSGSKEKFQEGGSPYFNIKSFN